MELTPETTTSTKPLEEQAAEVEKQITAAVDVAVKEAEAAETVEARTPPSNMAEISGADIEAVVDTERATIEDPAGTGGEDPLAQPLAVHATKAEFDPRNLTFGRDGMIHLGERSITALRGRKHQHRYIFDPRADTDKMLEVPDLKDWEIEDMQEAIVEAARQADNEALAKEMEAYDPEQYWGAGDEALVRREMGAILADHDIYGLKYINEFEAGTEKDTYSVAIFNPSIITPAIGPEVSTFADAASRARPPTTPPMKDEQTRELDEAKAELAIERATDSITGMVTHYYSGLAEPVVEALETQLRAYVETIARQTPKDLEHIKKIHERAIFYQEELAGGESNIIGWLNKGGVDGMGAAAAMAWSVDNPQTNSVLLFMRNEIAPEVTHETDLVDYAEQDVLGLAAAGTDPAYMDKLYGRIKDTPIAKGIDEGVWTDEVVDTVVERMAGNIGWVYDQVPKEQAENTGQFYVGARRFADRIAERHDLDTPRVSGVIASLSPQKDWEQNLSLAERVVDIWWGDASGEPASEKTLETAKIILDNLDAADTRKVKRGGTPEAIARAAARKADRAQMLKDLRGKSLLDLALAGQMKLAALWLRAYDEAYHSSAYRQVAPDGTIGDYAMTAAGKPRTVAWNSFDEIGNAIGILGGTRALNEALGEGHKVRSFYNNLVSPGSNTSVTIDTHAVGVAHLRPMSTNDKEAKDNFGGIQSAGGKMKGTYPLYAEAYRRAARERGIFVRELQSVTWEAIRGLFQAADKRTARGKIKDIWDTWDGTDEHLESIRTAVVEAAGGFAATRGRDRPVVSGPPRNTTYAPGVGRHEQQPPAHRGQQPAEPVLEPAGRRPAGTALRGAVQGRRGRGRPGVTPLAQPVEPARQPPAPSTPHVASAGAAERPSDFWARTVGGKARGFYQRELGVIQLTERANTSTFLHESHHAWLAMLEDLYHMDALPDSYADALKAGLGTDTLDGISKNPLYQERFAELGEQFLARGVVPEGAPGLRQVFRLFKKWMLAIYKGLREGRYDEMVRSGGYTLNETSIAMFETLYTTDTATDALVDIPEVKPEYMTDAEWREYKPVVDRVRDEAKARMTVKVLRDQARARRRAERQDMETKVSEEMLKENPGWRILKAYEQFRQRLMQPFGQEDVDNAVAAKRNEFFGWLFTTDLHQMTIAADYLSFEVPTDQEAAFWSDVYKFLQNPPRGLHRIDEKGRPTRELVDALVTLYKNHGMHEEGARLEAQMTEAEETWKHDRKMRTDQLYYVQDQASPEVAKEITTPGTLSRAIFQATIRYKRKGKIRRQGVVVSERPTMFDNAERFKLKENPFTTLELGESAAFQLRQHAAYVFARLMDEADNRAGMDYEPEVADVIDDATSDLSKMGWNYEAVDAAGKWLEFAEHEGFLELVSLLKIDGHMSTAIARATPADTFGQPLGEDVDTIRQRAEQARQALATNEAAQAYMGQDPLTAGLWLHGSRSPTTILRFRETPLGNEIWMTRSADHVAQYARGWSNDDPRLLAGPNIYGLVVRQGNYKEVDLEGQELFDMTPDEQTHVLAEAGYDGVVYRNAIDTETIDGSYRAPQDILVAFNLDGVKSWNAAFADESADIFGQVDQEDTEAEGIYMQHQQQMLTEPGWDVLAHFDQTTKEDAPRKPTIDPETLPANHGLPRRMVARRGAGQHLEVVSAMFGYETAEDFLDAVRSLPPGSNFKQELKRRTRESLQAAEGTGLSPENIQDEAVAALGSSEAQTQKLTMELELLRARRMVQPKKAATRKVAAEGPGTAAERKEDTKAAKATGDVEAAEAALETEAAAGVVRASIRAAVTKLREAGAVDHAAMRRRAQQEVMQMSVGETTKGLLARLANGQRKSSDASKAAAVKQDWNTAEIEAHTALRQHYLARAVSIARELNQQQHGRLKRLAPKKWLESTGIDKPFAGKAQAVARAHGFGGKQEASKQIVQGLPEWTDQQAVDGYDVFFTDAVLTGKDWNELTNEEARQVFDTVRSLLHAGGEKAKNEGVEWRARMDTLAEDINENSVRDTRRDREELGRIKGGTRDASDLVWLSHRKAEHLFMELDGFQDLGPAWRALYQPIEDANATETRMREAAMEQIHALWPTLRKVGQTKQRIAGLKLSDEERISIALNWGNEGNREALLNGSRPWTEEQLVAVVNSLSDAEWDLVENIWSLVNSYWPQIAEIQQRTTGVVPEKVEGVEIILDSGRVVQGQYYPIQFDPKLTGQGIADDLESMAKQTTTGRITKAATRHGHTKERGGQQGQQQAGLAEHRRAVPPRGRRDS